MQLRRNKFSAWKKIEKNAVTIGQTFCMRKRKKNILLMLPNITQFVKKKNYSFIDSKCRRMALSCSRKSTSIIKRDNIQTIGFILLQQKINMNLIRKYVKIKIFL